MTKLFKYFLIPLLFISCKESKHKDYEYIEIGNVITPEGELLDVYREKPAMIKTISDSLAYLTAYRKFCHMEKLAIQKKQSE